jgi:preprotein translocase subunit Sec61beta
VYDTFKCYKNISKLMAKKKEGSGLMSSAGLMRYYDAEETATQIDPKTVVTIAVAAGIAVLALNAYYRIWP